MSEVFSIIAKLRNQYPDEESLNDILEEEKRVKTLFQDKEFSMQPGPKRLLAVCRDAVIFMRVKLATDRALSQEQRDQMFEAIATRMDMIAILAKDYDAEIDAIQQTLQSRLEA